jgi:indole-3-glycerol phosphate synthase
MPHILATICRSKQEEIQALKAGDLDALAVQAREGSRPRGFRAALLEAEGVALIAEVKKASPSAGVIRENFDAVETARAYERGGASCISVLTDAPFFQGSPDFLPAIREAVGLPLLRKDFLLDPVQIDEARALGADACLLIVACLSPSRLDEMTAAVDENGMEALVEVHDDDELDVALEAGADLIGINNRDLRTFDVDLGTAERLAARVPGDAVLVAESGIRTPDDVLRLKACGIRAILVGETLMRAANIESAARALAGL